MCQGHCTVRCCNRAAAPVIGTSFRKIFQESEVGVWGGVSIETVQWDDQSFREMQDVTSHPWRRPAQTLSPCQRCLLCRMEWALLADGRYRDAQICGAALGMALQKFMAESPLQFDQIFSVTTPLLMEISSQVRREIIQCGIDDNERLTLYRDALEMLQNRTPQMTGLGKEIEWLVTSCWNYGA